MAVVPYALTTRQKIKDFLNIQDVKTDAIIDQLINSATAFIENYCGGRRFMATDYLETKDTYNSNTLFLDQKPVNTVSKIEYRAGLPSSPTWYTFNADSYLTYLKAGYIKFFDRFQSVMQAFRITYNAGYLISWDNEMDATKHTLPFDLTQVCTELVTKTLNTRYSQGIYQEQTEGQSITYESDRYMLNDNHKAVLNAYKLNRVAP